MSTRLEAILVALALPFAAGCSLMRTVFGEENGYLFAGYDAVAVAGEEVDVKVRLQSGGLLKDRPDVPVRFHLGQGVLGDMLTDDEGYAAFRFRPPAPGDYVVTAEALPQAGRPQPPGPAQVLVACREPNAPLIIVDLDKTLVASGTRAVLVGDPAPMPHSVEVMNRLAACFTPVYLTHRVDYFGPKSKAWLRDHGYPRGPVLLAEAREFLKGSREFKTATLERLRRRFKGRIIGVGDKVSDARAYCANGIDAFLLVRAHEGADAQRRRDLASLRRRLPPGVQVVSDWREIEQAIMGRDRPQARIRNHPLNPDGKMEVLEKAPGDNNAPPPEE